MSSIGSCKFMVQDLTKHVANNLYDVLFGAMGGT